MLPRYAHLCPLYTRIRELLPAIEFSHCAYHMFDEMPQQSACMFFSLYLTRCDAWEKTIADRCPGAVARHSIAGQDAFLLAIRVYT